MIFLYEGKPSIFIHIPKTGGNTIQKTLFDKNLSLDEMIVNEHQDGIDRFEIRGKYTQQKHMILRDYYKNKELHNCLIFTCVRKPLNRLVSLYFSPHRYAKKDPSTKKFVFPKTIEFDIDKFKNLVNRTPSCLQMLSFPLLNGFIPINLKIIRTENLNKDCEKIMKINLNQSRNISPFSKEAKIARENPTVKSIIENSHHQNDQLFFYG